MKNKSDIKEKFYIIKKFRKNFLLNSNKNIKKQTNNKLENSIELADNVEQKNKKIAISTVIFMILILFIAGYSIGKSFSEVTIKTKAEIATPILEVNSNPKIDVTAIDNVGEYKFNVTNYKEDKISDVDIRYYIEIKANVDESINFNLYKDGQEINLKNLCSEYIELEKGKKQEDNYVLKITYNKNNSNNIYDILEKVQIKIHSEQQKI